MSLTIEEREIVVHTWATVATHLNQAGVDVFIRLFAANPSYQQFFSFRDVPDLERLRDDKRLKAHVRNVMYALSMMVDSLDEPEVLQEMVDNIGNSHVRRKLNEGHFAQFKVVFIEYLIDTLGEEVINEQALAAWSKMCNLLTEALASKVKE